MKLPFAFLLVATSCVFTTAIPPNNECCDRANNEAECLAYTAHDATSFDNCVGGIGVDCDGVPYDIQYVLVLWGLFLSIL